MVELAGDTTVGERKERRWTRGVISDGNGPDLQSFRRVRESRVEASFQEDRLPIWEIFQGA